MTREGARLQTHRMPAYIRRSTVECPTISSLSQDWPTTRATGSGGGARTTHLIIAICTIGDGVAVLSSRWFHDALAPATGARAADHSRTALIWSVLKRVWARIGEDNVSVLAAAVSFYSLLSVFPVLTTVVSLYGLFADPSAVKNELDRLEGLLPPAAISLLSDWLQQLAERPASTFGMGLAISLTLSLWSARYATATMMTALNIAYGVSEARNFIWYNIVALSLTAILIAFVIVAVALVALLPAVLAYMPDSAQSIAALGRWPLMIVLTVLAIAFFYRYAPNRTHPRWEFASAGALLATALLVAGSYGFSVYVSHFATYDKTYGSLGAVVVLLMWFWLGSFSILVGAAFNAELARSAADPDNR
ncbi:YihY/virulence factor BrkB family protein [Xanthobacteraceae bacterium Astr-EGSB]|uniref:YihY/virulence factor BrkB family protein n=1 Tax=Astrobacterium formosum TaxID=3069710 RepID=UPI0027AF4125|nr:YihY/virulence factor BrkB family protein [Xanthobacteraceae bacterium Astr-EGSB]